MMKAQRRSELEKKQAALLRQMKEMEEALEQVNEEIESVDDAVPQKLLAGLSTDLQDEESTIAPSDSLQDDASESTEASGWCSLEIEADSHDSVVSEDGGRLVEGPGGKPIRVFRSSAELRKARLQQMQGIEKKAGKVGAKATQKKVVAARSEEQRQLAKSDIGRKLKEQAKSTPVAAPPAVNTYGAHRTLGTAGTTHSLPCGHIPFHDAPGGYPQKQTKEEIQRSYCAEEIQRHLDKHSREQLKEMGLWEYMPARNPVITRADPKHGNYHWHVGFQEFQHTLGGVPDAKPVERPHEADVLHRHLDAVTRDRLREAGIWEKHLAKNPVVTESVSTRGGANWHVAF